MKRWISEEVPVRALAGRLNELELDGVQVYALLDGPATRRDFVLVVGYVDPPDEQEFKHKEYKQEYSADVSKPAKARKGKGK